MWNYCQLVKKLTFRLGLMFNGYESACTASVVTDTFFCDAYWTNQLAVSLLTDWSTRGRVISPAMNFFLNHVNTATCRLLLLLKRF